MRVHGQMLGGFEDRCQRSGWHQGCVGTGGRRAGSGGVASQLELMEASSTQLPLQDVRKHQSPAVYQAMSQMLEILGGAEGPVQQLCRVGGERWTCGGGRWWVLLLGASATCALMPPSA